MPKKSYKRGEIAYRIYKLLHRNPDLTSKEVGELMPDVNDHTVASNISRMYRDGKLASRGAKSEKGPKGHTRTHKTYHVKYNTATKPKPKPKGVSIVTETVIPRVDAKLQAAYERLAMLHTETMAELAEEKKKVLICNSWWCKLKRKFS